MKHVILGICVFVYAVLLEYLRYNYGLNLIGKVLILSVLTGVTYKIIEKIYEKQSSYTEGRKVILSGLTSLNIYSCSLLNREVFIKRETFKSVHVLVTLYVLVDYFSNQLLRVLLKAVHSFVYSIYQKRLG